MGGRKDESEEVNKLFKFILGTDVKIKDNFNSTEESVFVNLINKIEQSNILEDKIFWEGGIDLIQITEPLWFVIENLFKLLYGREDTELIMWYLFERTDTEGNVNPVIDENDKEFILETPRDLWSYIKHKIK